ncbi:MAG: molybdopterin-guanine dinucleotide biosynthesis protein B, partial [Actinobacteria bacterium]|nr:molybdopterin-guanine dinucleotide biosynthesis protein B [Actinomycetota bacterium]
MTDRRDPPTGSAGVTSALLLAGGRGRRMGADKRLLTLAGRPLVLRAIDFLDRRFADVTVSVSSDDPLDLGDAAARVAIVPDAWPDASPLAGLASGLRALDRPLFAMAADLASPQSAALDRVLAAWDESIDVCLPIVDGGHEPLFAVYHPRCLAPMERLLRAGQHRIAAAFPELHVEYVPFPDAAPFHNINTMDDYGAARRLAGADCRPFPGPAPAAAQPPLVATQPPLVAIVGKSGTGKTTYVERLIPELLGLGLCVGTIKHDAHDFEIDHPGRDSYRHGAAGSQAYTIASPQRLAFVARLHEELPVVEIARRFYPAFDLVVAEGYKSSAPHRVELFRRAAGHRDRLLQPEESLALVTDSDLPHRYRFRLDDPAALAAFLVMRLESLRR